MILGLLIALACGCGGSVSTSDAGEPEPEGGWCCNDVCGMSAEDHNAALELGYTCTCDGVVTGADRECVEAQQ
jgi:hypothetical protein